MTNSLVYKKQKFVYNINNQHMNRQSLQYVENIN